MAHGFTASPWYDVSPRPDVPVHPGLADAESRQPGEIDSEGQATAALIAAKLITLCRSAGAGDGGLANFLDDLLAAVTARLDGPGEHSEASSNRLALWQETAAKKLMTQDLTCPPTLPALATACGMSANGFAKGFRGSTGLSPRQWLISFRIARAQDMLAESAAPLSAIALDCGFCDQSHFTRSFTRMVGKTPAVWRREVHHRVTSAPAAWREQAWGGHAVFACHAEPAPPRKQV